MLVKVEPTGCCERKGLVQIRFCMYLDEGDYGYDIHHVQVDGVWQTNPFHNHFIYVKPETPDRAIMDMGEAFLEEAYIKWACGEVPNLINPEVKFPAVFNQRAVDVKVAHLKRITLVRQV